MIVVSDTTPLNYLVLIRAVDVLPVLFTEVYVPSEVLRELQAPGAPAIVRQWILQPPTWLKIADPAMQLPSVARLDRGEADAISLAKERGISDILIDEKIGRKIALAEGLTVLPTITILERAAGAGLLDFQIAIEALQRTTFRAPTDKIAEAIARVAARKKPPDK